MQKLVFTVLTLQVLLSFQVYETAAWFYTKRDDAGSYIEICRQAPIDLAIVLDSSSSIRTQDFQTAIRFLQEFLDNFDIGTGAEGVRVSIITYGKGIYPEDGFNLDTYSTKESVLEAVGRITHRAGLYTDTGKAIKYMHEVQLNQNVVRPEAEKIAIVITDGNSQEWRLTKKMSEEARADGITMFAIGVGSGVRNEELLNIAGDESRVTKVETYSQLSKIKEALASKTCIKKEKPTEPPKQDTQSCGQINPGDVYFAFSPAALGQDATSWTTSFIRSTINSVDLSDGFRYGVVSGSCPDDEGFNLKAYSTVGEYNERLDAYDSNQFSNVLERVTADAFSEDEGGRDSASKIAVLVPGGEIDEDELANQVSKLSENGIRVFIADPTGDGVEVPGAETLTGQSAKLQSDHLVSLLCPK